MSDADSQNVSGGRDYDEGGEEYYESEGTLGEIGQELDEYVDPSPGEVAPIAQEEPEVEGDPEEEVPDLHLPAGVLEKLGRGYRTGSDPITTAFPVSQARAFVDLAGRPSAELMEEDQEPEGAESSAEAQVGEEAPADVQNEGPMPDGGTVYSLRDDDSAGEVVESDRDAWTIQSLATVEDVRDWCRMFDVDMAYYEARIPRGRETAATPEAGWETIYYHHLAGGLRLPLNDCWRHILNQYHLRVAQLTPNSVHLLVGLFFQCRLADIPFRLGLVRKLMSCRHGGQNNSWANFSRIGKKDRAPLAIKVPDSNKTWKHYFFMVRRVGFGRFMNWQMAKKKKSNYRPSPRTQWVINRLFSVNPKVDAVKVKHHAIGPARFEDLYDGPTYRPLSVQELLRCTVVVIVSLLFTLHLF